MPQALRQRLPSIRRRLIQTGVGIAVLTALLLSVWVGTLVQHEVDELLDEGLRQTAQMMAGELSANREEPGLDPWQPTAQDRPHHEQLVWQIVQREDGRVLRRSHYAPAAPMHTGAERRLSTSSDGAWRVVTLPLPNQPQRLLLVGQSLEERFDTQLSAVLTTLLGTLAVGALGTLVLSWRLSRELQPLRTLSDAVGHYDPTDPNAHLGVPDRAELHTIERAVRALGERLAQRVESERAFAGHAAHALRTPLAGIDVQLAMAARDLPEAQRQRVNRARDAAQRLSKVVQALLMLFRSGLEPQRQFIDLARLAHQFHYDGMRVVVHPGPLLHADPDLLTGTLVNLLDNAHRHQAKRVDLSAGVDELGRYWLSVRDDGQGCPPEQRERMQMALKAHDHRPDAGLTGLGLALANLVMRAHGGKLELPATERGFAVRLRWAVQDPDQADPFSAT